MDSSHRNPRRTQRAERLNGAASDNPTRDKVVNWCVGGVFLAGAVGVSAVVLALFLRLAFWIAP